MAITLKSTLLDLGLTEDDVEAHVLEIIQARPTGAERRSALSYIRQLVQRDEDDLEVYRALIARARSVLEDREVLHTFDIRGTKHANLFTVATGVDYETPLTVANSEVIAEGATIVPAGGASRIVISANYVSLHGIGSGSAVDQTLQCGCIVNGGLSVSGSNVLVEGVDFKPVVDYTVIFTGTPTNIVFRNCRFDGALYVAGESTFFYGLGFAGSFTLENCEIKNYTSWMLADLNSDGTVQTGVGSALTNIVIKDCRFFDCKGSFAARGIVASPTESAKITGNTWGYSLPFTATSMHPSFWNAYEVNNCKEVVCKQNTFAGTRLGGNGVRGFFQCWSKADIHYVFEFERNTVSGLTYVVQVAASSSFYSPDQKDRRLLIKSEPGKITDVTYGLSLFYPWDETVNGAWNPTDVARFASPPSTDFADSLANQA